MQRIPSPIPRGTSTYGAATSMSFGAMGGPADETTGIEATLPDGDTIRVTGRHLSAAMDVPAGSRHELTRRLLGAAEPVVVTPERQEAAPR